MPVLSFVIRELKIFFEFSWRDWSVTVIPGSIFAVGAMRGLTLSRIIQDYLFLLTWLTFYIYPFNLSNQILGVEEDKINKPDRPIPSGEVSLKGAKVRCLAAFLIFIGTTIYRPVVFAETVVWIICIVLLAMAAGKHWFVKNTVTMTAGTVSLLSASWKIFAPHTSNSETWVYSIAAWAGILAHIQDLRDVKGDAIVGRKTMPLTFGNQPTRLIIAFIFIPVSIYVLHVGHIFELAPRVLIILPYHTCLPRFTNTRYSL